MKRWTRRALSAVLASVGISLGASAPPVRAVTPEAAPASWLAYAELLNRTLTAWLSEKGEVPARLRAYLDQMQPTPNARPPAVRLKVWVDPQGVITKIDFTPFLHAQPNMDLRSLLIGRPLPAVPPSDMLQPIRLELQLQADAASAAAT